MEWVPTLLVYALRSHNSPKRLADEELTSKC